MKLSKTAIEGLREVSRSPKGLTIYPDQGFFCSGNLQMTAFRALAGNGLVEVVGGTIFISAAGLSYLAGKPVAVP